MRLACRHPQSGRGSNESGGWQWETAGYRNGMKLMAFSYGAVFCAIVAACGGTPASPGNSQSAQGAGASPSGAPPAGMCTSVAPPKLAYPASGASGVPDGNFQLVVSYSNNPGQAFTPPALSAAGASSVTGSAWSAGSSGSQWVSNIPALAAATAYTVRVTNSSCNQTYTLGTFTTK